MSAYFALGNFGRMVLGAKKHIQNDQGRADRDGGVGDVERRVVVIPKAYFKEIGNRPVKDAIGDVPGSATQ